MCFGLFSQGLGPESVARFRGVISGRFPTTPGRCPLFRSRRRQDGIDDLLDLLLALLRYRRIEMHRTIAGTMRFARGGSDRRFGSF